MICEECERPLRPYKTRKTDYPGTLSKAVNWLCYACYQRRNKQLRDMRVPPIRKQWKSEDLFAEIDHLDGSLESKLARLGTNAGAVEKAAYRHGRRDLARAAGQIVRNQRKVS